MPIPKLTLPTSFVVWFKIALVPKLVKAPATPKSSSMRENLPASEYRFYTGKLIDRFRHRRALTIEKGMHFLQTSQLILRLRLLFYLRSWSLCDKVIQAFKQGSWTYSIDPLQSHGVIILPSLSRQMRQIYFLVVGRGEANSISEFSLQMRDCSGLLICNVLQKALSIWCGALDC